MKNKNKIIAIIPARGGSKSVPDKNIKSFAGEPLIYWAAKAANDSRIIDKVIISTDSEKIKKTAEGLGLRKVEVIGRSKGSSRADSSSEMALIEAAGKYNFDDLVFLQATSPFTGARDIDSAYELYRKGKYDSVFSAVLQKRFIWGKQGGKATPLNYDYKNRPMRQNFKGFFVENGALFITSKKRLLKHRNRLSGRIGIYRMPEYSHIELDEPDDWKIAESVFLKYRKRIERGR